MPLTAADTFSLLSGYGYPALGVVVALAAAGVPIPAPVTMMFITLGALSATAHGPNLLALLVIGTLAATLGHSADYGLGYSGSRLLPRVRAWLERRMGAHQLGRIERQFAHSNALVILLTRFPLTPLASPVSVLAGASRVAYRRFLLFELLGETAYFTTGLLLGRLLGAALSRPLTPVALGPLLVLVMLVMLLLLAPIALMRARTQSRPASTAHPSLEETVESAEGQPLLARPPESTVGGAALSQHLNISPCLSIAEGKGHNDHRSATDANRDANRGDTTRREATLTREKALKHSALTEQEDRRRTAK